MLRSLLCILVVSITLTSGLPQQDSGSNGLMGFDTGNPAADHEAGMWTAALIGERDIYFEEKIIYNSRNSDGRNTCCSTESKSGVQKETKI